MKLTRFERESRRKGLLMTPNEAVEALAEYLSPGAHKPGKHYTRGRYLEGVVRKVLRTQPLLQHIGIEDDPDVLERVFGECCKSLLEAPAPNSLFFYKYRRSVFSRIPWDAFLETALEMYDLQQVCLLCRSAIGRGAGISKDREKLLRMLKDSGSNAQFRKAFEGHSWYGNKNLWQVNSIIKRAARREVHALWERSLYPETESIIEHREESEYRMWKLEGFSEMGVPLKGEQIAEGVHRKLHTSMIPVQYCESVGNLLEDTNLRQNAEGNVVDAVLCREVLAEFFGAVLSDKPKGQSEEVEAKYNREIRNALLSLLGKRSEPKSSTTAGRRYRRNRLRIQEIARAKFPKLAKFLL